MTHFVEENLGVQWTQSSSEPERGSVKMEGESDSKTTQSLSDKQWLCMYTRMCNDSA
ncbi:hypothetical protein L798_04272 [Zootermopsis nevadensis]|uniref:Uncharacterized protein n=1 Tax=Zootermopsis nevadensis TaxID=136037 RepID=A0A067RE42_ZOONE|nr:hypothetical protein L798_04272 [Zootermopsis nevadensis]